MAIKPIQILINAKDNASSVFLSLKTTVIAVGATIATYFGINAFAGVVKGAGDFEAAMSRVKAATGASAEEMAKLTKLAKDAAASSGFSNVETADALTNLAKAGANATEAMDALPGVINLAKAGEIELAQSSEYLTKIIAAMGGNFSDAGKYADVLAMGANASNTSVTGLADALSYAAPAAKALNLSLETTVGIIGKFADGGIDASRAGTALNAILSQFLDPASKFRNELALAGITTNNFKDALTQLAAAGPRGANAILAVGTEAGPALRGLLNAGIGALDELIGKLQNAGGSAAATAKTLRDNLNGSLSSLANAWEAVKDVLGTPVLPVIKDGVDQLAAALKSAVADGTVAKFGEAVATAFQAGIKWVREFLGTVDFTKLIADLQSFATRTGEVFTGIGDAAKNAGAIVQTAYGAIQASGNALLTALYGTATGLTLAIQGVLKGLELLYLASSKITFGDVSKQYAGIADDFRIRSEAMGAAVEALAAKVRASMGGVVEGTQNAVSGVTKLASSITQASDSTDSWKQAVAAANAELEKTADAATAAAAATEKKAQADLAAKQSADEHRAAIALLRAEYQELVSKGDLQAAAVKQQEINKALQDTGVSAKEAARAAADAAAQIDAAFGRLGVTSAADLKRQAEAAQRDYATIKEAGTSTAEDISEAFKVAAEKAIAANKGIAPSWVEAEAAARGYRVVIDASGKATIELANKTDEATGRMARGWHASREAIQANTDAMDELNMRYKLSADYTEREIALLDRQAAALEKAADAKRKYWNVDKDGFTLDANGQRQQMSVPNGDFVFQSAKGAGLSEADALALMDKYFQNGRPTGVAEANGLNGPSRDWFSVVNEAISKAVIEQARRNVAQGGQPMGGAAPAASPVSAPAPSPASGISAAAVINLYPGVDFSNRSEAERLARFIAPALKDLQRKNAI